MTKVRDAILLFEQGFHCSQALLVTYGIALGIDYVSAMKVASAFGGGINKMGDTCGSVTGALMVIGLKYGFVDANDKASKTETDQRAERFVKEFKARNKSLICRELIGFDIGSNNRKPDADRIILDRCPKFVKDAAEIIEEIVFV